MMMITSDNEDYDGDEHRQIDRVVEVMMMYDIGYIKINLTMITNDDVIFDDYEYIILSENLKLA